MNEGAGAGSEMVADVLALLDALERQGPFLTAGMALDGNAPLDWAGRASHVVAHRLASRFAAVGQSGPVDPDILDAWALLDLFGRLFTGEGYKVSVKSRKLPVSNRMLEAANEVAKRVAVGQQQAQAIMDVSDGLGMHPSKIKAGLSFRKALLERAARHIAELNDLIEQATD